MFSKTLISVVIPAYNEQESVGKVISEIPRNFVNQIIVVDNGSTDRTAEVARRAGAQVVYESKRGYGRACLRGLVALEDPAVVVFLDADYSDYPEELIELCRPILNDMADMVIGSRVLGESARGALLPQARFGNWLAVLLIRRFFWVAFTDLGPFRAISYDCLQKLNMTDTDFGWTVEMQVKAALGKIRCMEIPVRYRKRIGHSKITGTISGSLRAGLKILLTIFRHYRYNS
ncbi:MAG: glycosyltransferase family 2 protein [Candidatus Latescibacterota bacterium]|nr:glycosyltransferase family 2 protein [Candidatus Latescibacterota bacterium]